MNRPHFAARTALALSLSSAASLAQAPTAPTVAAPATTATEPGKPTLAPPPAAPGATGPDAPISKVTQELAAKLENMMSGNGLTADQVAERAVRSSYQLQAKRKSIEATEASLSQAKAGYWPSLNLSARYTRFSDIDVPNLGKVAVPADQTIADRSLIPPGSPLAATALQFPVVLNQYVLQAELTIPLSDYLLRTSKAVSASTRAKNAAEIEERATRLSVARDARVAYYQWIRAQGMSFVGAQSVEQAKGHLVDANNAFQAGLISKADVLRAQSGVKSAELFRERADSGVQLATTRLRVLMRDEPSKQYEVGENILAALPPLPGTASEEGAYREASGQRLELKTLRENEQALHEQASLSRAGNYPRLDARGTAQYANPNPRVFPQQEKWDGTWDASVVLSWAPTAIFGASASARALDARAAELTAQRHALLDGLRLEVSQALSSEHDAQFAVSVSQQALTAAEEGYRVRRELFRSGRATMVEVTDSETELTRARLEVVNAHVDLRIAQVELAHALGRDVK